MNRIVLLAFLTLKEGIRDRAMNGVLIVAILMIVATIFAVTMFGWELGKVTIDLNLSVVTFSGLLLTFFVNINLMAKDIDKRTIHCVLSKPISRQEYILGKFTGIFLLVFISVAFLTLFGSGIIALIKSLHPGSTFRDFSWACYFQAVVYELLMFLILNAVVIFFSAITSSSFLTLLYSISVYIVGQSIEEVMKFLESAYRNPDAMITANKWLMEILKYLFPNFSAFDIKVLASHGFLMSGTHTVLLFGYSLAYTGILLLFAILIFKRRELQ